jgi:hypothetical protein
MHTYYSLGMPYAEVVTYSGLIVMFVAPVMILVAVQRWWRILAGTLVFWGVGLLTGLMARDLDPLRGISTWEWMFILFGWIPGQFYCLFAMIIGYANERQSADFASASSPHSKSR